MPSVPVSAIPTVSQLYKDGKLSPQPANTSESLQPAAPASTSINSKVSLIRTSITTLATTCIVNAANESLMGGGGVDGAIHAAAGPSLVRECKTLNGCDTGSAKITAAYELPCKYVIHAVGPIYWVAKEELSDRPAQLLKGCYDTSLRLAAEKGGSVAFSCLSTGVYGYPPDEAAEVACKTVRAFMESSQGGELDRVIFCCFEGKDERAYERWIPKFFPPAQEELPSAKQDNTVPIRAKDTTYPAEPVAKPAKSGSDDIDKDWEAVDKPNEAPSEKAATDISEEGEKVEAPDLGADDGEKVEKPVDELAESGEVLPKSGLLKDW
ncbi:hypothetical protein ACLMJK_001674 [Lecanora helva]